MKDNPYWTFREKSLVLIVEGIPSTISQHQSEMPKILIFRTA
jgi:hypothetical protein